MLNRVRIKRFSVLHLLLLVFDRSSSFLILAKNTDRLRPTQLTHCLSGGDVPVQGESSEDLVQVIDPDYVAAPESRALHTSLASRITAFNGGIGKRYVCRTQKGFLNVHREPGNPYDTSNIASQLRDGQIVTSTGPNRGSWIQHDGGGWSISVYGEFVWLERIKE